MAGRTDDELTQIEADAAAASAAMGAGDLARTLAGTTAEGIGTGVADRYARIGARMLSDPMPTRLDADLIDRLSRAGFDSDRLRQIRVHRGLRAHAAADALGARAFAVGEQDIFFARGEFDPSSREGRAVLAHEVAHIAPPAAVGAGVGGGGFGGPVLNERKRGDEDAAGEEAHEGQARRAEAMVYAQDDSNSPSQPMAGGSIPETGPTAESPQEAISEKLLEDMVLGILHKLERSEIERRGRF